MLPDDFSCKVRWVVLQMAIGCGLFGFLGCADSGIKSGSEITVDIDDGIEDQIVSPDFASKIQVGEVDGKPSAVDVVNLSHDELKSLGDIINEFSACQEIFPVYVGGDEADDRPAMLGSYSIIDGAFRFIPRFGFDPGMTYGADFNASAMPIASGTGAGPFTIEFIVPAAEKGEPTLVEQIYPTRGTLPENQLKFYLHFSAPMSQGDSYQYIHLLREDGSEVEMPFLELTEELWDPAGTRLTLFIDPGRIKRGVKPREEIGPSLEEGKKFTLLISEKWPDAHGRGLTESFRKKFDVAASDRVQPALKKWQLQVPRAHSQQALEIVFAEPLDHAMLQRVLLVKDSKGRTIEGLITVDLEETRWRFQPAAQWKTGKYRLVVDTTLEDLAGNNLSTPFEVDVFESIQKQATAETLSREFEISPEDK